MPLRYKTVAAILITALIAGGAGWWVWNRWFTERANPSLEMYPVRGIDISAHNGDVDFAGLRSRGVQFAYIKATEGTDFIDRKFIRNAEGLRREGIPTGAYHFFRFDTDGELQAWNFIRAMHGRDFSLPPAIDLEEWTNDPSIPTSRVRAQLKALLGVLRDEGYSPMIYTNRDGYQRFVQNHLDEYPLWICSFTDPPLPLHGASRASTADSIPWHIWQYSHRGVIDGISGYTDLNCLHPSSPLLRLFQAN